MWIAPEAVCLWVFPFPQPLVLTLSNDIVMNRMHSMHPFFRVPYGIVMRLVVAPLELNIKIPFVITSNTLAKPTTNTPKVPNPLLLPIYHTVFSHGTD